VNIYVPGAIGALIVLVTMVELLRKRRISEKYAALWLMVSVSIAVLAVAPGLLGAASRLVQVKTPSNLLLLLGVVTLLLVCVHLSCETNRLEEETRTLAEEIALLRLQVETAPSHTPEAISRLTQR
jgi:hypothetical protein